MSKEDYSLIDTEIWQPVQSPGLRATKHQLAYDSPKIQSVLTEAFTMMFPSIVEDDSKQKRYQVLDENGRDIFPKAVPVKNMNDIPRAEMMRLMEGWIRLRRKLQDENHPNEVMAILLNFRVPNPRQSLDRYMLYKRGDESRLIVRWGYETKEEKAVSLERAISILMDVPLGHMRSILSTTMSPNATSTVPVGPLLAAAEAREKADKDAEAKEKSKKGMMIGAAAAAVVVIGGIVAMVSGKEEKVTPEIVEQAPVNESVALGEKPVAKPQAQPKVEEVAVAVPEPKPVVELVLPEVKPEPVQPAALPSMNDMMADLSMSNAKPQKEKKNLSLDAMLPTTAPASKEQNNLLNDMLQ